MEGGGQLGRSLGVCPLGGPCVRERAWAEVGWLLGVTVGQEGTEPTPGSGSWLSPVSYVTWQVTVILGFPICAVGQ